MAKNKFDSPVYDLKLNQGDDKYFQITIKDGSMNPVNITGYDFRCKAKTSAEDADVLFKAEPEILDAANGIVRFHFKDEDTQKIDTDGDNYSVTNSYTYDVLMKDTNGDVTRLVNGTIYVSPGVSWDND